MRKLQFKKIGTLSVIASLLMGSAGFRVLGVSSAAFALEAQSSIPSEATKTRADQALEPDLNNLLASFKAREQTLSQEEDRLAKRAAEVEEAEKAIGAQLKALEDVETRLRTLLAIADEGAEDDVARLTTVYENMKPKAAAIVFEEMQPTFAAGFLSRMRPEAAALVLAGLKPETAYAISVVLAGRHSGIEKN